MRNKMRLIIPLIFLFIVFCDRRSPEQIRFEKKVKELAVSSGLTEFQIEHGIGPVTTVESLPEKIETEQIVRAKAIWQKNCRFCHKVDTVRYAPSLRYVTDYRSPSYILNILLNPEEMTEKHPLARKMAELRNNKMRFKQMSEADARAMLAYLTDLNRIGKQEKIAVVDTVLNLVDL